MLLVPKTKTKVPLFDHVKLSADLSMLHRRSFEPKNLPFTTIDFADSTNASVFQFRVDTMLYQYDMRSATLTSKGRAPRGGGPGAGRGGRGGGGGQGGGGGGRGGANADFRNFSPDSTAFVFAREHNLYYVDVARRDTVKISTDGVRDYSFGARDTTQVQQQQQQQQDEVEQGQQQGTQGQGQGASRDPRVRANVTWSQDSKAFFITRSDQRKVAELYLLDMLAEPRPKLTTYKYPMPGEANVRQQELWAFNRADGKLTRVDAIHTWTDEALSNLHWEGSSKLRLVRRDRLRQHLELIEVDLPTRATRVLVEEVVEGATLEGSPVGNNYTAR